MACRLLDDTPLPEPKINDALSTEAVGTNFNETKSKYMLFISKKKIIWQHRL